MVGVVVVVVAGDAFTPINAESKVTVADLDRGKPICDIPAPPSIWMVARPVLPKLKSTSSGRSTRRNLPLPARAAKALRTLRLLSSAPSSFSSWTILVRLGEYRCRESRVEAFGEDADFRLLSSVDVDKLDVGSAEVCGSERKARAWP
jgi:hypothetical protein